MQIAPPAAELRVLGQRSLAQPQIEPGPISDDSLALTENQVRVGRGWQQRGRDPTILPAWMAEAPMWLDPRHAMEQSMRAVYTGRFMDHEDRDPDLVKTGKLAIELLNPVQRIGPANSAGSPHGLLRYQDLDLVMAIMQQCIGRSSRSIEYEAGRLLEWLGKDPEEYANAYRALRSSILRLTSTQIVIYLDGLEQHLPPEDLPAPFTILVNDGRRQERGVIRGKISDYVANDVMRGNLWQMVDVKAYRHLMLTSAKSGLSRVMYLFLSSLRKMNSQFECSTQWIQERYGEKLNDEYRFRSPYDRSSRTYRALQELADSGVISFKISDDGKKLSGLFAETSSLPELPMRRARRALLPMFGEAIPALVDVGSSSPAAPAPADPVDEDAPSAPASPAAPASSPAPAREDAAVPQRTAPTASENDTAAPRTAPPAATPNERPLPDVVHASIGLLNNRIKCHRTALNEAVAAGWTKDQILHAMIDTLHGHAQGHVIRPGGFLATCLREQASTNYDKPSDQDLLWLESTSEWRELPWLKARRAAERKAATARSTTPVSTSKPAPAPASAEPAEPRPDLHPDLVAAWTFALRQIESQNPTTAADRESLAKSNPTKSAVTTWFDPAKVVVLGLEADGWLAIEASNALYSYTLSNRFGKALAIAVGEALGSSVGLFRGLHIVLRGGTAAERAAKGTRVPYPLAPAAGPIGAR